MTARLQGNREGERQGEVLWGLLGGEGEIRQVGEIEISRYLCHLLFCLFAFLCPIERLLAAKRLEYKRKKFNALENRCIFTTAPLYTSNIC